MAVVAIKHAKVVSIPDDPNYPVGSNEWNENHIVTGLEFVDNTSDANKPVSTAQAAAIAVVQSDITAHEANMANPHAVTKAQVGLGNVDNTSDANKPVSTAQQAALDAKVSGPAGATDDLPAIFDGTTGKLIKSKTYAAFKALLALVKGDVGLGNVDNTSDANKPVSTAQAAADAAVAAAALPLAGGTMTGSATLFGAGHWQYASPGAGSWYNTSTTADRFFVGTDLGTDKFRIFSAGLSGNVMTVDGATGAVDFPHGASGVLAGLVLSNVPTLTEFTGGQISTQGVLGNSLSVYAAPTAVANSTVFSAAADYTSLSGGGTVPVASFGATTGASHTAHVRVNSTFLEDYSTAATQPVALFAMARKHGGNASQFVFASNIQVTDESAGSGAIIGLEIDVDGKSTTSSSLGLGIYARNNGSLFNGGNAMLIDANEGTWNKGLLLTGVFGESGFNTVSMTGTPFAVHMGNNQRLAWDGATAGTVRAWITFNQATTKFEFYIDGTKVAQLP